MAVISPSILKILSDLDIDLMDVDSDMDYLRALMEATNALTISNPSDRRIPILQTEVKRVRDNRRSKSKIVKKKISTAKFFDKKEGERGKESNTGKLARILRDTRGRVLANESILRDIQNPEGSTEGKKQESKKNVWDRVVGGLNSILNTLKNERKFDKKISDKERREKEKKKRLTKEKLIEGGKSVWKGITTVAGKLLSPFKDIWSQIIKFLSTVLLGRVLYKILEWGADSGNQKKLQSILKFLKNWWPTILAAYLLFGTGFTKMVAGLVKTVIWGVGGLLKLIPLIKLALAKLKIGKIMSLIPGGKWLKIGALALGGTALTAWGVNKMRNNNDGFESDEGFGDGGETEGFDFNKGGKVPGSGEGDTVPAMLTPGEFVMTKGAVNKFGVNTFEGMNAAAGGKNTGSPSRGFKEGGKVSVYNRAKENGLVIKDLGGNSQFEERFVSIINPNYKIGKQQEHPKITIGGTYASKDKATTEQLVNSVFKQKDIDALLRQPKPQGFKRNIGGLADFMTAGMWDFDQRNRQGSPKDWGINRIAGGLTDWATMGVTDFDKRGKGNLQVDPLLGGKDRRWGAADEQAKRGEKQSGFGLKRGIGGALDFMTLGMWDFDKQNRAGSPKDWGIRRMAGGITDWATMGLTDFDKRGSDNLQFNPIGGGKYKKWEVSPSYNKPTVTVAYQSQLENSFDATTRDTNEPQLPAGGNKQIPTFSAVRMRSPAKIKVLGISV